jgi:hypothetical protein
MVEVACLPLDFSRYLPLVFEDVENVWVRVKRLVQSRGDYLLFLETVLLMPFNEILLKNALRNPLWYDILFDDN